MPSIRFAPNPAGRLVLLATALAAGSCAGDGEGDATAPGKDGAPAGLVQCTIPESLIFAGAGKDQIPSLSDPVFVRASAPGAEYLTDDDRVVGLRLGDAVLAVPLNILWWHEIVNLDQGGRSVAITHCPLTGSSLAFDRAAEDGSSFGVSGLLYLNNLMMYDRATESFWPQMARAARCGPRSGTTLSMIPVVEMRWRAWRELNPNTLVVGSDTGFDRDYRRYPYGSYDRPGNDEIFYPMPSFDARRPPKERVLGIAWGAGVAFPFGSLDRGAVAVVDTVVSGREVVVFWDRASEAAMAYDPVLDGQRLHFAARDGAIVDVESGSVWNVEGWAADGLHRFRRLEPVAEAFVAYWFAWAAFFPETALWK